MKLFVDNLGLEESELIIRIKAITIELQTHPLYKSVSTIEELRIYMAYQVWCVWDFMTLLKALQNGLIVNKIEWIPPQEGSIAAYIYEILLTEETDITDTGSGHASHFETYVKAMRQAGANTKPIDAFISSMKSGNSVNDSLKDTGIPDAALVFVQNTLKHAHSELHKVVAVFCLSREGIIPDMFKTFLSNLKRNIQKNNDLSTFLWYLQRHIEVDSDSHGPLSVKLFKMVVGEDSRKLSEGLESALDALIARKRFLDLIMNEIKQH